MSAVATHLDYLHLVCGLAWMLFGCMCRYGIHWKNRVMAGWLQLAVFTLAAGQWSRVLNDSLGVDAGHDLVNFYLTVLPTVLLLEFALEAVRERGQGVLGRWAVYLAGLAFAGWFRARAGLEHSLFLQAMLILPGALASLALLRRSNWRHSAEGRWLALATLGLGGFIASTAGADSFDTGLSLGWGVWTNGNEAHAVRPWLVVSQILISWGAVGAMSVYQRISHQKQLAARPSLELIRVDTHFINRQTSLLHTSSAAMGDVIEIGTRWLVLAWIVLFLIGGIGCKLAGRNRTHELRDDLLKRAELAAAAIDPDWLAGLSLSPGDLARPEYQRLKKQLTGLRQANKDGLFVCLLRAGPEIGRASCRERVSLNV